MPPRLMCFALITRMAVNTVFHRVINSVFNTFTVFLIKSGEDTFNSHKG